MSDKKLLLHIGTGKTGSTTIQETLYRLNKRSELNSVTYPKLLGKKHHNELCTLVMPHERIRRDIRSRFPSDDDTYKNYVKRVEDSLVGECDNSKEVVLSGEYFCGFNDAETEAFITILRNLGFTEIHVLIYFRDPVSLYLSQVQQRIKASSRFSNPGSYKFNYLDILNRWDKFVDKITVREFDRERLIENDVVSDFKSIFIKTFEKNSCVDWNEFSKTTNESLSPASMLLIHEFRRNFFADEDNVFDKKTVDLLKLLAKAEKELSLQKKPKLKDWVEKIIIKNHSDEIDKLKDLYGINFSDGYRESSKVDEAARPEKVKSIKDIINFDLSDYEAFHSISVYIIYELLPS